MKQYRPQPSLLVAVACAALALTPAALLAQETDLAQDVQLFGAGVYDVTIYNLTAGQTLSPPLVVSHRGSMALFQVGEPALPELATLAEEGDPGPLADLLANSPEVRDVAIGDGTVPPGGSITIRIQVRNNTVISAVGMLSDTNDAFFAIDGISVPRGRNQTIEIFADAYDAGSEANNESCGFIPGPSCGGAGAGVSDEAGAEGFVHIHGGIQAIADLEPSELDWRNPVAKIVIARAR